MAAPDGTYIVIGSGFVALGEFDMFARNLVIGNHAEKVADAVEPGTPLVSAASSAVRPCTRPGRVATVS